MINPSTIEHSSVEHIDDQDLSTPLSIGILSDTHGVVADCVKQSLQGSQLILHAGDVCGQSVLDELCQITPRVIAVGGNNDFQFSYSGQALPDIVHIKLPGGTLSLLHGHQFGMSQPSHVDMSHAFADSKSIIYGHTHKQVHDTAHTPWILNPGAAGATRTQGRPSCAVLTIIDNNWNVALR